MTEFFRHCPGCGKRFHIRLENKKLVTSHVETIRKSEPTVLAGTGRNPSVYAVTVHEGKPTIVDVEEFQYTYKCGHCGHEWSEKHIQEHRES